MSPCGLRREARGRSRRARPTERSRSADTRQSDSRLRSSSVAFHACIIPFSPFAVFHFLLFARKRAQYSKSPGTAQTEVQENLNFLVGGQSARKCATRLAKIPTPNSTFLHFYTANSLRGQAPRKAHFARVSWGLTPQIHFYTANSLRGQAPRKAHFARVSWGLTPQIPRLTPSGDRFLG